MGISFRKLAFFRTTLWDLEPENYGGLKRYGIKYLQVFVLVVKDFWSDQCMLRASSLAFTTILSLVPFFALTFAVLKGLGVQNKLEPLVLEQVTAGSEEFVEKIITYINNTNMTSLGAIGLITLIASVIALIGSIEDAFNVIWRVRETRSLYRKFSDYLSVIVSGPILLVVATSITTSLQSQTLIQWLMEKSYVGDLILFGFHLAPYAAISVALVFLYIFIPNTKVRFKSALIGGILAGTCWQGAQWVYLHFQVGVAKYNAIYGTLAVLPIFMVWIYTSWLIVLFGVEVVYVHQNIRTYRAIMKMPSISHGMRELLIIGILQKVAMAFVSGASHWSADALAEELHAPENVIRELISHLVRSGYLVETNEEPASYQPARPLEQTQIQEVIRTFRSSGHAGSLDSLTRRNPHLHEVMAKLDDAAGYALEGMTLQDLADRSISSGQGGGTH